MVYYLRRYFDGFSMKHIYFTLNSTDELVVNQYSQVLTATRIGVFP